MTSFRADRFMTGGILAGLIAVLGCAGIAPDDSGSGADEIDPAIYSRIDDPDDPFRHKYAEFRARRERDMTDPDSPRPLERYPARHRSADIPWAGLDTLISFDWASLESETPERVAALERSVRLRVAFDHPDLQIRQFMLGPGATFPAHGDGAPGMFVVVGGRGTIQVEGEASRVTVGSTVKLEPYAARRIEAGLDEPLRIVWIRWAPGGDQSYIDAGYYLTGANQHKQPKQADFEDGYLFWGPVDEAYGPTGTRKARVREGVEEALARVGGRRSLYPDVPVFGHESEIPWLSAKTLKAGGFFFSDDLGSLLEVADRMIRIARHKAIFRASRPDGRWDFNFSQSAWGPRSTYVEHSHVIPEFYYMLSGPVIYGVDGDLYEVQPGDILFNNSYSPHLARGIVDGLVFRSFSSTFAPNGDRSVFDRPAILIEPLPEQPAGAALADDVAFH